jgi:hypothetical protein
MGDTFLISGPREKRSAVAGQIVDLRRQVDKLQADLTLRLDADIVQAFQAAAAAGRSGWEIRGQGEPFSAVFDAAFTAGIGERAAEGHRVIAASFSLFSAPGFPVTAITFPVISEGLDASKAP